MTAFLPNRHLVSTGGNRHPSCPSGYLIRKQVEDKRRRLTRRLWLPEHRPHQGLRILNAGGASERFDDSFPRSGHFQSRGSWLVTSLMLGPCRVYGLLRPLIPCLTPFLRTEDIWTPFCLDDSSLSFALHCGQHIPGMPPSDPRAILEGEIKEVDVKEISSTFHETKVEEWHISDNHQQNLSFSDVSPADITVRNLEVEIDAASSFVDTLKTRFTSPRVGDLESVVVGKVRRKKVLKDVSADFPAGTMTAIIGGSGSGKVRSNLLPTSTTNLIFGLMPDNPSQCPLRSHARIEPHNHREYPLQWIPRPSHCHQRLRGSDRRVASIPDRP